MSHVSNVLARFCFDRSGATGMLFGMLAVVMMMFSGLAVDMGRWVHSKKVTSEALDAAVLAGARSLMEEPDDVDRAKEVARAVYEENVSSRFDLEVDSVDFEVVDNGQAVEAVGEATLKTLIMRIAGIDELPVITESGAGLPKASKGGGGSNIEVSVMLDVTGSMCDNGSGPCTSSIKLDGLRVASKKLIDMVVQADQSQATSRIALVPFSTRVRVGPNGGGGDMMTALTGLDPTWTGWFRKCQQSSGGGGSESGGNWQCHQWGVEHAVHWKIMPCVTDRFYKSGWVYDYTDNAPGPGQWLNAHDGTRMPFSKDSTDTPPPHKTGQTPNDPATHWNYRSSGYCSNVAEENEIMPLTSDKNALNARIDGLEAFGATAGALGTAWSWYMLSPEWNGAVWQGDQQPGPYADGTPLGEGVLPTRKVAVLMTDGVFNTYRSWKGQDQQQVSDYAKQLCENMKAKGIEIYTVGFDLDSLPAAERAIAIDTLQSCGTDIEHFYNTFDVDELVQAFKNIGAKLSQVTLTR